MKYFYVIALLITVGLALLPMTYLQGEGEDEYVGKVVNYTTYGATVKSLDPATCGDVTSAVIQGNIYEGLYWYHYLKRPLEIVPQLADGMPEISDDGLTYTIKIKRGVKYSRNPCFGKNPDGTYKTRTVRAADFVLAFKRVADYHINTGLAWAFLSGRIVGLDEWRKKSKSYPAGDFSRYDLPVEGLKALDDYTFQIKLRKKFPQMMYVLAMHVYAPIPREAVDYWLGTEDDGKGGRRPIPINKRVCEFRDYRMVVGTGPYMFKEFVRKNRIVLVRNPDFRNQYYPTEGAPGDKEKGLLADAGKKVPFIDVIRYDYVAESYSAWMRFLTKQTDSCGIPKEVFKSVITPGKKLGEKWRKRGIRLYTYSPPVIYWLVFNMEDPIVGASKSLRQALCLAYDVENHIKILYNGRGKRATNILPSLFKEHDLAGPGPYYRLDLQAAKRKLEQAKKELARQGKLINGKIPQLRLDLPGNDRAAYRMGEFVQQQFRKLGIDLKVIGNDWATLQEKVNNKRCQIYAMGWHADYPDPENFLQLFYSPNIAKGTNNANYSNPEYDRLYERARVLPDCPERRKLYVKMVRIISEDCPVLLLSEPISFFLTYKWMKNIKPHPVGYGYTRFRRIDTALRKKMGGR